MKPHHYLAIVVRLFAIVLTIMIIRSAILYYPSLISIENESVGFTFYEYLLASIFPLFVALILWFFPIMVSKKILKPELDQSIEPISPHSFFSVIIISIGVYYLFYSISDAIYWLSVFFVFSHGVDFSMWSSQDSSANVIATIAEFIMSMILIIRGKTIAFYLMKFTK
ncbi:MAG: hypothetical protein OEY19_13200 [Gammaproteobacteria bacterium]|nr:hypothetical protein [Gammaproteobacteria bacterium]